MGEERHSLLTNTELHVGSWYQACGRRAGGRQQAAGGRRQAVHSERAAMVRAGAAQAAASGKRLKVPFIHNAPPLTNFPSPPLTSC